MPPPLPDRYTLEVRIGRDGDVDEWLATDTQLDRPVLVRVLGPESSESRRNRFVDHTRAAAGVTHQHIARVYEVAHLPDGAYSIGEWPGGIRLSDREHAGLGVDLAAFLPNAEGLARGLAALHAAGTTHGAIDGGAVFFSSAHPAKLAAFGRVPVTSSPDADVRSLAATLEEALTGLPAGEVPPSEVIDGLSAELDVVLETAREASLTADGLAERFAAVPAPKHHVEGVRGPGRRSWIAAAVLVAAAAALIAVGTSLAPDPVVVPDASTTVPEGPVGSARVLRVRSFDPLGDGQESDRLLANLTDGDPTTVWRTETYVDPLPLLKAGVGIAVSVEGTPTRLVIEGMSTGTLGTLRWRAQRSEDLADWETLQRFASDGRTLSIALPERPGGVWLVWIEDLPADGAGFRSEIGEVSVE
jgi:hypothetical protein